MKDFFKDKKKRKIFIVLSSVVLSLLLIIGVFAIYVSDYYHADIDKINEFDSIKNTTYQVLEDDTIVFDVENATTGVIFYPGGKVDYKAYLPLMASLAENGILSIIVEMPFNLAVFDMNAADDIIDKYNNIESWYIAGHSLGGSMAASYLEKNHEKFDGLILLGSYSTADLSSTNLKVLSIYGSEDKVLNLEKYDECKNNLPSGFVEHIVKGACHAYFGVYGEQDGDGTPTISNEEQIRATSSIILEFIK